MSISFEFVEKDAYLVATIPDRKIDARRAISILKQIASECKRLNCGKVLLDESTLEARAIETHEIRTISENMPDIYLACLCKSDLIDEKSRLFNALTFTDGYTVRHFSVIDEAIAWLLSKPRPPGFKSH